MACRSAAFDRRSEEYILERMGPEMAQATFSHTDNTMVSLKSKLTACTKALFQSGNDDRRANDSGTGPVRRRTLATGPRARPTKHPTIAGQHSNQENQGQGSSSRGNYVASNDHANELMRSLVQISCDNKIRMDSFGGQREYLSDKKRKQLITKEAIERAFPDADQPLVDYIHDEASKIFAIVLRVLDKYSDRLEAMKVFRSHGFNDSHLPVPKINLRDCPLAGENSGGHLTCSVVHEKFCKYFHHSCWVEQRFIHFGDLQKNFISQTFNTKVFQHHVIKDDCFLPFLAMENEEEITSGGFGTVYPARMPVDYLDDAARLFVLDGKEEIKVAIKVLQADPANHYDLGNEWTGESDAHEKTQRSRSKFNQGNCQLPPRFVLERKAKAQITRVEELLDQLVGLAQSLHAMHNKKSSRAEAPYPGTRPGSDTASLVGTRGRSSSLRSYISEEGAKQSFQSEEGYEVGRPVVIISPPPAETSQAGNIADRGRPQIPTMTTPDVRSDSDGESTKMFENWRHGDIKPANILRFENKGGWLGTLKLADLGRAKQRQGATQEQRSTEIDLWRSKAYEAPDIHVDSKASMSRLYDSWSFGTVIFDIIVWMLYGHQSLHSFAKTTAMFESQGSPYWTRHGNSAEVSTMANLWMSHILPDDTECNRPEGTAIGD
ncbi:uncharacterized protein RAG0_00792 [Rhynchosporium agropyri]|uniref:Protein kinase domain-containing protein n=1 Tax=Rhynchosporium agropyri TaxID=914238 RepID=A0A1E1JUH8_9HELO|nr:uncharacterized protein RAG0_00792 [Rhynchosporium agropyri]